jgi:hypothetical protein
MTPTDAMNRPAWQFWMDARIRAAGVAWENEAKKKGGSQTDAGVASEAEKEDLVRANEDRAEQREQMDGSAPSMAEQMDALQDLEGGD